MTRILNVCESFIVCGILLLLSLSMSDMEGKNGLKIEIKERQFKVALLEGAKEIDSEKWEDEGSLSQVLLVNIEKVLTRNNLKVKDLALGVDVSSDNESYTSARIAKVTSDMINFSLREG